MSITTSINGHECIFDEEDKNLIPLLYVRDTGHAFKVVYSKGKDYGRTFARVLLNAPKHLQVDHKNRNALDNRKENLRLATGSQSMMNQSVRKTKKDKLPKGIIKVASGKYLARITINYLTISLGTFLYLEDAVVTYEKAAEKYHGEFASHKSGN